MTKPKRAIKIACLLTLLSSLPPAQVQTGAQTPSTPATVVEDSQPLPRPPAGTLGTRSYEATDKEKPFFACLRFTGILPDYPRYSERFCTFYQTIKFDRKHRID